MRKRNTPVDLKQLLQEQIAGQVVVLVTLREDASKLALTRLMKMSSNDSVPIRILRSDEFDAINLAVSKDCKLNNRKVALGIKQVKDAPSLTSQLLTIMEQHALLLR